MIANLAPLGFGFRRLTVRRRRSYVVFVVDAPFLGVSQVPTDGRNRKAGLVLEAMASFH